MPFIPLAALHHRRLTVVYNVAEPETAEHLFMLCSWSRLGISGLSCCAGPGMGAYTAINCVMHLGILMPVHSPELLYASFFFYS